jgi:hypothetical protein
MTAWIAPEGDETTTERRKRRPPVPHLVCMWEIDPASKRLSCVWASPAQMMKAERAGALRLVSR